MDLLFGLTALDSLPSSIGNRNTSMEKNTVPLSLCFEFSLIRTSTKIQLIIFFVKLIPLPTFLSLLMMSEDTQLPSQSLKSEIQELFPANPHPPPHLSLALFVILPFPNPTCLQIQQILTQICLLDVSTTCILQRLSWVRPGSFLTRTREFFSVRIGGNTSSIYIHYELMSKGKLYQERPTDLPYFPVGLGFCSKCLYWELGWMTCQLTGLLISGLAAHLLQVAFFFFWANLCFLLAFCGWSRLAEVTTRSLRLLI